jgi:MarR family transcriptional regulator, organic hydroperoxide resistance regulator
VTDQRPESPEGAASSTPSEVAGETWRLLHHLMEEQVRNWSHVIAGMGLTAVQAHTIDQMASMPPCSMSALASRLGVDPSWVTGVIDQLESRGDARRRLSRHDRRVKLVELTEQGRRTHETLDRVLRGPPPSLADLPERDLRELARILRSAAERRDRRAAD